MALTPLKCPNCGALIPRERRNCEYCGANFVLSPDNSSFLAQKQSGCPQCSNPVVNGSWFCSNCGLVLTPNIEHLQQIQKKLVFSQENLRKIVLLNDKREAPVLLGDKLEQNEFVHYVSENRGILSHKFYFVTEKKLVYFETHKKTYLPIPMKEIITIGKPYFTGAKAPFTHWFNVQTFTGNIALDFGSSRGSQSDAWAFHRALNSALSNYNIQKRDFRAVIISLKISQLPPPPPPP